MSLYSLKMRASKHSGTQDEHISGAEKILPERSLPSHMNALLERALHHAKGRADFINLKIEAVLPSEILYIDALPVTSIDIPDAAAGRKIMLEALARLGIQNGGAILAKFKETYSMRGAMLLDADTLERLEPNPGRGIRATCMDALRPQAMQPSDCKNHFQEALVLASKVINAPHIIAELCISDDPDYVTGYIAAKSLGYQRITRLKAMGCPDGGRIFLYRGPRTEVPACIDYLEKQHVLVRNVPDRPLAPIPAAKNEASNPWQPLAQDLAQRQAAHLYRSMNELSSAQSAHVRKGRQDLLMLASNSYLGLIDDLRVKTAAQAAISEFGTGSGGSRLTTGTLPLHTQLEHSLAAFKDTEASLLYNTGYMANVGILSALAGKDSIIFSDALNHASIIDGCRLSRARVVIYRHADMDDLAAKIHENQPCRGIIVSDAVFSMDGDIAPLPEIVRLARANGLLSMVDEAHSTGVIGQTGRGICEYFSLTGTAKPDILMGTLSKALASEGGFVCGSQLLIDELINRSRSFIFSTSLSPAVLAAAQKALEILQQEPERVQRLQANTACFCDALQAQGITASSGSAIVPIGIGSEAAALVAAEQLEQQGICLTAIRFPTVAKGSARLRAALMSTHTQDELISAAKKIAAAVKTSRHTGSAD